MEYAIVAPLFVLLVIAVLGTGINGFYQLCLDDSVRNAARQLQLGGPASASGGGFVAAICQEFGALAADCQSAVTYDVQATPSTGTFGSLTPAVLPGGGSFPDAFPAVLAGRANVLVQVSYPLPFVIPYLANAITLTSANAILSVATVRMEPLS